MCARVGLGSNLQRRVLKSRDVGGELSDKARRQFALLCDACGKPSGIVLNVLRATLRHIRHVLRMHSKERTLI